MNCERQIEVKGLGEDGTLLPAMFHCDPAFGQAMDDDCLQQFGACRAQRVRRFITERFFEGLSRRKFRSIFANKPSDAAAKALGPQSACQQGDMEAPPRLFPGTK